MFEVLKGSCVLLAAVDAATSPGARLAVLIAESGVTFSAVRRNTFHGRRLGEAAWTVRTDNLFAAA